MTFQWSKEVRAGGKSESRAASLASHTGSGSRDCGNLLRGVGVERLESFPFMDNHRPECKNANSLVA